MRCKTSTAVTLVATAAIVLATVATTGAPAAADAGTDGLGYAHSTAVGVHNTYDKAKFAHLAQALDTGAGLIELDVYADTFPVKQWRVNHDLFGQSNNCTAASTAAQLYTGSQNHTLDTCLDNLRLWHAAHPGHQPVIVKVELKVGFAASSGLGPSQFDALLTSKLGDALYTPTNLLTKPDGSGYPSLDAAAQADNWPTRAGLAGKFIFEIIPGTVELGNPFDTLKTDVEYGQYLRDHGGHGAAFPAVLGAASGDPRTRYSDTSIRPQFVVFDGDATAYATGGIDTSWYDTHHYPVVMTDAAAVPPALDGTNPSQADALARIALLAHDHASIVSTDWSPATGVLATVVARG
jgi:Phosphoinositide phospholipase C, Ca2+-dependent